MKPESTTGVKSEAQIVCTHHSERGWRDIALRAGLCFGAFMGGCMLLVVGVKRPDSVSAGWANALEQLGLTLCITAVLYFVFEQVFDRSNKDQVERIVNTAVGTVDQKIEKVDDSLDKLFTQNSILKGAFDSNLICIYEKRAIGLADIMADIRHSTHVRMLGISLREYFMTGGHYNSEMDEVLDEIGRTDGRKFQALIINRCCDQAAIRAERECDTPFDADHPYERSGLYADVDQSMLYLRNRHNDDKIEGKVYNSAPSCFLVITDRHTYVEQYHYGLPKSGLKGGHFPLLKFPTDSTVARHLEGHFDYVWQHHSVPLDDILQRQMVGVSRPTRSCGLVNLFPSRSLAEERLAYLLDEPRGTIRLIGISLRDFFHAGRRFYRILERVCVPARDAENGLTVRALLLDPLSEQGRIRSEREEPGVHPGNLFSEVMTSLNSIERLRTSGAGVEAKLYSGAPNCFVVLTEKSVLIEQYHYGSDAPGATILGGKVPLLEFARESAAYAEMSGHFDFLWSDKGPSLTVDRWRENHATVLPTTQGEMEAPVDRNANPLSATTPPTVR